MKTMTTIFTILLTLQFNMLFSANTFIPSGEGVEVIAVSLAGLAPATPREATFEEFSPAGTPDFSALAPVLPAEADFSDSPADGNPVANLAPVLPHEATFEE
jgi:hypothetical protein